MNKFPENVLELINANLGGFNNALGLRFTKAAPDEYVAELEITDRHLQPYGLVHGGVYAGMIETLCSTGAALTVWGENKNAGGPGKQHFVSENRSQRPHELHGQAPLESEAGDHVAVPGVVAFAAADRQPG